MCMCVYNYVLTPTIHAAVSVLSVHRSTTRNTPWTRPAARHRTSLLPRATIPRERSIHISAVGSSVVHGISTFSFLSLLDCSPRSFFFSSFVRLTLFLSFRYSSLPHPPCYRVQGQPIEGNFLVPIAFVHPPRTIRFVSFPFFYSSELCFFFSRYTFPFFLASLSIYFSFSLLFRRVSLQIREGRCQNGGEKHRWKLVRNAFDR